jgi:undecaprenyl-diphosphatase
MRKPGATVSAVARRMRELWRFSEARLLLIALIPVAGIGVFVTIADEVAEGELEELDRAMLLAMRAPGNPADPIGPWWVEEAMRDITALGSIPVLALATLITAGYLLLKRSPRALALLLVSASGGLVLSAALKVAFGRPRPELVTHVTSVLTASFPSGHASMSAVVYLTLAALLARLAAESRRSRARKSAPDRCPAPVAGSALGSGPPAEPPHRPWMGFAFLPNVG